MGLLLGIGYELLVCTVISAKYIRLSLCFSLETLAKNYSIVSIHPLLPRVLVEAMPNIKNLADLHLSYLLVQTG